MLSEAVDCSPNLTFLNGLSLQDRQVCTFKCMHDVCAYVGVFCCVHNESYFLESQLTLLARHVLYS